MRKLSILILCFIAFLLSGCGSKVVVVKATPAPPQKTRTVVVAQPHQNAEASLQHLQQAKMFYARDKYKQAMQHCEKALSFDERNWEAYYYLGLCMQHRRQYAGAIDVFASGLKHAPDNNAVRSEMHAAMGYSFEHMGKPDEASKQYSIALSLNPQNQSARQGQGRMNVEKTIRNRSKDTRDNHDG